MTRVWLACVCVLLAVGCGGEKQKVGVEELPPKTSPAEASPDAAPRGVTEVMATDNLVLELTVYHPPYVYLTGDAPVTALVPAMTGFVFEKKAFPLDKDYFPLSIPLKITREAPVGDTTLRIGLRIQYAYKADDKVLVKNALLEVPLKVLKISGGPRPKSVRVPIEYFLPVQNEVEVTEVK
jgi:hypothetical protein